MMRLLQSKFQVDIFFSQLLHILVNKNLASNVGTPTSYKHLGIFEIIAYIWFEIGFRNAPTIVRI